ncbi:MAG: hypothetical protein ACTSXW_08780 [Candidatus Baldrarchaeia archaeon]
MKIEESVETATEKTELEKLCSSTPKIYEALKEFLLLDPTRIDIDLRDAIENAKKFEKTGKTLSAASWYRIAGGLAIYKGDVKQVKKIFTRYAELTGKKLKILELTEEAVKAAQRYYKEYLGKSFKKST